MTQAAPVDTEREQDLGPRCLGCKRLLAVALTRPWIMDCPRCGTRNQIT